MKIMYIHGFGSTFDVTNPKVQQLARLGEVVGIDIDYTQRTEEIQQQIADFILEQNVTLLVGTSMGGYYAGVVGTKYGVPFVAVNPAINPAETLRKFEGSGITFLGKSYVLHNETIAEYGEFPIGNGRGLILLDLADELIDPNNTAKLLEEHYQIKCFEGGSHRFDHLEESLPIIEDFVHRAEINYEI